MIDAVMERDVDLIDAVDREWWSGWCNYVDGAGFDVARFEAESDFLTCGCHGRDWTCGHFGWSVAIVRPAS
ncbi:hypothetical protein [Mycobacterium avium]|uniref:hypothetical protein n=1 Tax=Mycobacterium avium TaxID=1764 RepID=UPI00115A3142|nr:hypothetical protein [Mycobacterium avium]